MAIYDCFQYFNEDHMVDLRLNILSDQVDYFVISESTKTHQGKEKKLNFDIKNFKKFEKKIIYTIADYKKGIDFTNHKGGESEIEQHQRNNILSGLRMAHDNDLIIMSDSDEIPDMSKLRKIKSFTKYTAFSQMMFMYKLNLQNIDESNWIGSKVCLKKNFLIPQRLEHFEKFLLTVNRNTKINIDQISYLSPLWTYKLLTIISILMVTGEIIALLN